MSLEILIKENFLNEAATSRQIIRSLQQILKDVIKTKKDLKNVKIDNEGEANDIVDTIDNIISEVETIKVIAK